MASRTRVPERAPSRNLVGPAPLALRSCGVTGFAFGDLNGNGVWDKPAEPGLAGWTIYADLNDNG